MGTAEVLTSPRKRRRLLRAAPWSGGGFRLAYGAAAVPIGQGPDRAGFDSASGLAFSPNGRDGTLTVILEEAPDKYAVAARVPTRTSARTMALDRRTHAIYLAAARFAPQPVPAAGAPRRRPALEPNSFAILVFGR